MVSGKPTGVSFPLTVLTAAVGLLVVKVEVGVMVVTVAAILH